VCSPGSHDRQSVEDAGSDAQGFLDALSEDRWQDAAALIHPETIEEIWRRQIAALRCAPETRKPRFEDYLRMNSDMPPAKVLGGVAEGDWVNVLYRYSYELQESDVTGDVELYRPPAKQLRLRQSSDGWRVGFAGPMLGQTMGDLGPGVLPRMGEVICPGG
jgi:hypothetical protein